jgi:trk system potassium uptake protein
MTFIVVTLVLTLWLATTRDVPATDALRHVAFNVASILSTTGFVSEDYSAWGAFAIGVFFYLMFIGGCTGSTAGGIKIFRLRVLVTVLMSYTKRRFQPHLVTNRVYDGKALSGDVVEGVMAFVALYFATVAVVAIGCAGFGLDWLTSISGSITAVGNVGPGLGPDIGPVGNFAGLPDGAKWLLAFGMLAGRLELFTVLVVLTPSFWRD